MSQRLLAVSVNTLTSHLPTTSPLHLLNCRMVVVLCSMQNDCGAVFNADINVCSNLISLPPEKSCWGVCWDGWQQPRQTPSAFQCKSSSWMIRESGEEAKEHHQARRGLDRVCLLQSFSPAMSAQNNSSPYSTTTRFSGCSKRFRGLQGVAGELGGEEGEGLELSRNLEEGERRGGFKGAFFNGKDISLLKTTHSVN